MKILQVAPRYPPQTGGVETHVKEISERLVDRGHEVVVHTADATDSGSSHETRNGVTVHRHRAVAPDGAFHVAPGILPAVYRSQFDVAHAHNYHSLPLLFAAFGVRDRRFVVTPHYHGRSADPVRNRLLSVYKPLGRWTLHRADRVVAVSEWERDHLRADFGVEATVIPNGLRVERFREAEPADRDRPYLLTVGRLEEYKGVQHLIRALPEIPEYDLVVAGDGPYRDRLEAIAREAGVRDRVVFEGFVERSALPALYAGASVYVTLSEHEAYGMTVAEALASETPCVVRESGALVEWTSREGCVGATDGSPSEVGAAVRRAGKLTVDAVLPDWESVTVRLVDVYRDA